MSGQLNTSDKVRRFVGESTGIEPSLTMFCVWGSAAMYEIASAIAYTGWWNATWEFDEVAGETTYPKDEFTPGLDVITNVYYGGNALCRTSLKLWETEIRGSGKVYGSDADNVYIVPASSDDAIEDPVRIVVCGNRFPDTEFYDIETTDTQTIYRARKVDLPPGLETAFAYTVLSFAYVQCEDPGQAAIARENASMQLGAWRKNRRHGGVTAKLFMNGASRGGHSFCCPDPNYCPPEEESPICDCECDG